MAPEVAGRCAVYKKCTKRFLDWLRGEEPVAMKRPQTVASIVTAARNLAVKGRAAPASVREDLARCIEVRTEVRDMYRRCAVRGP